jgi:hypothetical protein
MVNKSFRPCFICLLTLLVGCLFLNAPAPAQQINNSEKSATNLYEEYKKYEILPCGQRAEAVRLGRMILEQYQLAKDFGSSFKTRHSTLEAEEVRCTGKFDGKSLGELFDEFKTALTQSCGERVEAVRLGKEIVEKFSDDLLNKDAVYYVRQKTPLIEAEDKKCREADSLEALFDDFKIQRRRPCGERSAAIQTGRKILEYHRDDKENQEVILFVEKDLAVLEKADPICARNARYNLLYKQKNWRGFLTHSKVIISEEGDTPLALDVMLTFVAVAHKLSAYQGDNSFNTDAVNYAKKALELIEAGVKTQSSWGVFEPYETKDKALGWLNYSIGYISYFRQKEGKKAIPYFYKATQFGGEFKYDAFVYQAVAIHYFEKKAVTPSSLTINDFITKANNLGLAEDTTVAADETAKNNEIAELYKQLVNLYNLRYNLADGENVNSLTDYIEKIINRPLIDPATSETKGKTSTQAKY